MYFRARGFNDFLRSSQFFLLCVIKLVINQLEHKISLCFMLDEQYMAYIYTNGNLADVEGELLKVLFNQKHS